MTSALSFMTKGGYSIDAIPAALVESFLVKAMSTDQLFCDCLDLLEDRRPDLADLIAQTVEGVMFFCEDSPCAALGLRCRAAIRKTEKEQSYSALLDAAGGGWDGFEMQNRSATQFAVLGSDASEAGRVRATLFDANGFSGHRTRNDFEALVRELISEGYVAPATGALAVLSQTADFKAGNASLGRIDSIKRGLVEQSRAEAH